MATIIIENQPKKTVRPNTTDSTMFVSCDGKLYFGYYLRDTRSKHIVSIKLKIK